MSDSARPEHQSTDRAYSAEILGVSLEILPENARADVVNLKEPSGEKSQSGNQAVTSALEDLKRVQAGFNQEHQWRAAGEFALAPSKMIEGLEMNAIGYIRDPQARQQTYYQPTIHSGVCNRTSDFRAISQNLAIPRIELIPVPPRVSGTRAIQVCPAVVTATAMLPFFLRGASPSWRQDWASCRILLG
jgi:hypothetical protein